MTIEARIITDSIGPNGVRITTFVLKYPRFIHSEFMTHRDFSRNASSSRAIPFEKQLQMIKDDMAFPIAFRKNQKGMQAGAFLTDEEEVKAVAAWANAGFKAIEYAQELAALNVHKQYINRLLEPYAHISVVVTATRFSNFFALRHHPDAQPEIAELAKLMWEEYRQSWPEQLKSGHWHLPFVTVPPFANMDHFDWTPLIKQSVARCARVSYLTHEGKEPDEASDFALYDRLLGSQPIHASPAEHQARASAWTGIHSGNFNGWVQYRKTLEHEYIDEFTGPLK